MTHRESSPASFTTRAIFHGGPWCGRQVTLQRSEIVSRIEVPVLEREMAFTATEPKLTPVLRGTETYTLAWTDVLRFESVAFYVWERLR